MITESRYMQLARVQPDNRFFELLGDACKPKDHDYFKQEIMAKRAKAYQVQSKPVALANNSPKFEFFGYAIITETDDELVLCCFAGNLMHNIGSGSSRALIIAFKEYAKELNLKELRIHTERGSAFDRGLRNIDHDSREIVYRIGAV